MTWYRTGTVSVENASTTVTGSLTAWLMAAKAGDAFVGPDGARYEITAVNSNTEIEIYPAYAGSTASGQSYAVERISTAWNSVSELSVTIAETAEAFQRGFAMRSTTSIEIGAGEHEFAVPPGLPILPGATLNIASAASGEEETHWFSGVVTEYEGQTLKVLAQSWEGEGDTRSNWNINIGGRPGLPGEPGDVGWSPVLAIEADDDRRVLKVVDWQGGTGSEPAAPKYVGASGLVDTIGDGVDVRGPAGEDGEGTGDVVGPAGGVADAEIAVYSGTTGKAIAGGGTTIAALASSILSAVRDGVSEAFDTLAEVATALGGKLTAANNLSDVADAAAAFAAIKQTATASATGVVELATAAETTTGTDETRAVTPDGLAGSDYGKRVVSILVFDDSQDVSTGDGAGDVFWRVPAIMSGWNLVAVAAQVQTAGTTGTTDVQIARIRSGSPADMLSTKITIDSGEIDSATAAAAAVINGSNDDVQTGDQIRIDVDAVSTTPPKGLLVELAFQLP